jgi:hypothetical protein
LPHVDGNVTVTIDVARYFLGAGLKRSPIVPRKGTKLTMGNVDSRFAVIRQIFDALHGS